MATIINASNSTGLTLTSDLSGVLQLQSLGTTIATINSAGFSYPGAVVQTVYGSSTSQVSGTTTTYTDTGVSATITPKYSTSKVLVITTINTFWRGSLSQAGGGIRLLRGSTVIAYPVENSSNIPYGIAIGSVSNGFYGVKETTTCLDSPATTNATTYKTQIACFSGSESFWVNQNDGTAPISTIILMEIAQ